MPHWLALYLWLKTHPSDERAVEPRHALRVECWNHARAMRFPRIQFRPWKRFGACIVPDGSMAWAGMCKGAPVDDLADAILELEVMSRESDDERAARAGRADEAYREAPIDGSGAGAGAWSTAFADGGNLEVCDAEAA